MPNTQYAVYPMAGTVIAEKRSDQHWSFCQQIVTKLAILNNSYIQP